jgi:transglutaminase-like putative cysteine protease
MTLSISPRPSSLHWLHDVFDNSVAIATFAGATDELRFESEVTLEHDASLRPDYCVDERARRFPFAYDDDDRANLGRALERRYPDEAIVTWASAFLPRSGSVDTLSLLQEMTFSIRERCSYRRRLERGIQSPTETLERRTGTCRDFALLMIEGVRAVGLAARFVSGYLIGPEFDPDWASSAGSTHAWVQVFLPGAGWIDFDPTNRSVGNAMLIPVGVAWDPEHVLPLWGTFFGQPGNFLKMDVAVRIVDGHRSQSISARSSEELSPSLEANQC